MDYTPYSYRMLEKDGYTVTQRIKSRDQNEGRGGLEHELKKIPVVLYYLRSGLLLLFGIAHKITSSSFSIARISSYTFVLSVAGTNPAPIP